MEDGIYSISVRGKIDVYGDGILVLRAGTFNGGTQAYICKGEYDQDRDVLSGEF